MCTYFVTMFNTKHISLNLLSPQIHTLNRKASDHLSVSFINIWLRFIQMYEFFKNGVVSLLELPDNDDTVRLLLLLLLLPPLLLVLDKDDTLDLEETPDSDPDPDPDPDLDPADPADLVVRPLLDERPDLAVRPDLDVRSDLEEMPDRSERSDLDDSSDTEDTLVLEVIPDTVDRAVVDLFCSGSGTAWILITLERETHYC